MGLNTTLLLLNDYMAEIQNDKDLGEKIRVAINVGHKSPANGIQVIETHHADNMAIVAVGGNTARVIGFVRAEATDLDITKELAQRNGLIGARKPTLDEVKALAKEYGWRCVVLRRKEKAAKKFTVTRKKVFP